MNRLHRLLRKTEQVIYPGRLVDESDEAYLDRSTKMLFKRKAPVFKANLINPEGWEAMLLKNVLPSNDLDPIIPNESIN